MRINNEGAEADAIHAFEKVFGSAFKLVFGSLKDVGVVHGEGALIGLEAFMRAKEIAFVPFSSRIATWEGATGALLTLAGIRKTQPHKCNPSSQRVMCWKN